MSGQVIYLPALFNDWKIGVTSDSNKSKNFKTLLRTADWRIRLAIDRSCELDDGCQASCWASSTSGIKREGSFGDRVCAVGVED